jgi:hypothetical protein
MKKKFLGIPVIALVIVISLIALTGGTVFAYTTTNHMTSTGNIQVNGYTTQYGLDNTVMVFHPATQYKAGERIVIACDGITVENTGDQPITGFSIAGVAVPFGSLLLNTVSGLPLENGETTTITLTFDGVAPDPGLNLSHTYDLSSGLYCDLVPTYATVVFDTGITSDGGNLAGTLNTNFTISTSGVAGVMHVIGLHDTTSTPNLANGNFNLTLQANAEQQSALTAYFAAKAGWTTGMQTQIGLQISGSSPFFFLKSADGVYTLVDNFKKTALGYTDEQAVVTVDDDYPVGTYVYSGTVTGTNGATQSVIVTLIVTR